mmetsp:Transcript_76835/g.152030  ORF Transcript_76835/g.152030 Transcript_76835/m.152030 type:complete len:374 (-) Transcript_76835:74-1195(-)
MPGLSDPSSNPGSLLQTSVMSDGCSDLADHSATGHNHKCQGKLRTASAATASFLVALLFVSTLALHPGNFFASLHKNNTAGLTGIVGEVIVGDKMCKSSKKWCGAGEVGLFCFSQIVSGGPEEKLIKLQLERGVSIFACDDYLVTCAQRRLLGKSKKGHEVHTVINSETGRAKMGDVKAGATTSSFLNVLIFMKAWDLAIDSGKAWSQDWTVKVDPDCVFFPDRLRDVLIHEYPPIGETGPAYLNNCFLGMHGPIEVLSKQAVALYRQGKETCRMGAPYAHKQEDFFFRECWQLLGIAKVDVFNILLESNYACTERPTTRDGRHPCFSRQVSFHPFKSTEAWFQCHKRAMSQAWSPPLFAIKDPPGPANFHHA